MTGSDRVRAWRPRVAGVTEVLHAAWRDHSYPAHTHDTWTLLLVDDGLIGYELDRHRHAALRPVVTLLPPHVVHDGGRRRPGVSANACSTSTNPFSARRSSGLPSTRR